MKITIERLQEILLNHKRWADGAGGERANLRDADLRGDVIGADCGFSKYDGGATKYVKGETVRCHGWDDNRWEECSGGIHFFITREEAEAYE